MTTSYEPMYCIALKTPFSAMSNYAYLMKGNFNDYPSEDIYSRCSTQAKRWKRRETAEKWLKRCKQLAVYPEHFEIHELIYHQFYYIDPLFSTENKNR